MAHHLKFPLKTYELIEHTADLGIKVRAKDLRGLFKNAGLALFDIITKGQKKQVNSLQEINITQQADNLEELFINWLNELLSLSATKELIFMDFKISKLDKSSLEAVAFGSGMKNYKVNVEVKAATYHQLKIEEGPCGWQARVIFDV